MLSRITGVKVQPNKAIVGENAFAHEAGIHQDGVLKNKQTYEIMTPESIGITEKNLVLGKHSGKFTHFRRAIKELGYEITEEDLNTAFIKFKELADKRSRCYDSDIEAIVTKETVKIPKVYALDRFAVNSGNTITNTAVVRLSKDDKLVEKIGSGDGPLGRCLQQHRKDRGKETPSGKLPHSLKY